MGNPFVSVINLGCRVNRVECDRMERDLAQAGLMLVEPDEADVIVINTCAVTGEAEAKTRKAIRHALDRARSPYVLATGCAVNLHPESLLEISDRVALSPSKVDVVSRVLDLLGYEKSEVVDAVVTDHEVRDGERRARVGVKIQDGCNNRCTYCIVWKARGPERSVPVSVVLDEVRAVCDEGLPEVVLTGVNLGAYDGSSASDAHVEIDELVRIILDATSIEHVRLSSIEPMDVSERLLDQMAAHPRRVAPFLHLPVQSGSSSVLARMERPYTADDVMKLAARIRAKLPGVSLSSDMIVGFPGETDDEFEATLDVARAAGFSRIHVFRYSARPGTPAAAMPDQVRPEVMATRSQRLRALALELAQSDARARVGTCERAVIEQGAIGTLASFHKVRIDDAPAFERPRIVDVAIIGIDDDGLLHARMCDADKSGRR